MVFNPSNMILLNYMCCECKYFQINQIVENNCVVLVEYYGSLPFTESHMILSTCIVRYDLLIAHKEELGQLITLEQGKPLKEAMGEVSHLNFAFRN